MDDQKEENTTPDMVVGSDGSMNNNPDAQKIEVKTEQENSEVMQEPNDLLNEMMPPPVAEPEEVATAESTSDFDVNQPTEPTESMEVKQPPVEENSNEEVATSSESLNEDSKNEESTEPMSMDSNTVAPAMVSNETASQDNNTTTQKPHEHRNNKKLAIITTLIVALLLAGGAVYLYLSTQNNTEESDNSTSQLEPTEELPPVDDSPATAEDVDQATQETEEAINALDDTSDFSEESLSDQNLGIE